MQSSKGYMMKIVLYAMFKKNILRNEQKKMLKSGTDKENKRNGEKERNAQEHKKKKTKERRNGIIYTYTQRK